jgi:LmbE family N-acetylglucosaminyl deacetylase
MAGGTIARFAALGHEVVCLYLTRGEAGIEGRSHADAARVRTGEAERACAALGARPLFAGQVDGATEVTANQMQRFRGREAGCDAAEAFALHPRSPRAGRVG